MKLIYGDCGTGKTKVMLQMSQDRNIPILCETPSRKARLLEKAQGLGLSIPTPIVCSEITPNVRDVLVDDPYRLLEAAFNVQLQGLAVNIAKADVTELE